MSGLPGPFCPGIHLCGLLNLPTRPEQERTGYGGGGRERRGYRREGGKRTELRGGRKERIYYRGGRNEHTNLPAWRKKTNRMAGRIAYVNPYNIYNKVSAKKWEPPLQRYKLGIKDH